MAEKKIIGFSLSKKDVKYYKDERGEKTDTSVLLKSNGRYGRPYFSTFPRKTIPSYQKEELRTGSSMLFPNTERNLKAAKKFHEQYASYSDSRMAELSSRFDREIEKVKEGDTMVRRKGWHKERRRHAVAARKGKGRAKIFKRFDYQTGKRKDIQKDRMRYALPSGIRRSKHGRKYSESRRNRSDLKNRL